MLEDLKEDKFFAPSQTWQVHVLAYQLPIIMLSDDLISISRWGMEVRLHNGLDCVGEETEVLWTALRAT